MDSSHLDQTEKSSPETCSDSSVSPGSPDNNDIFGDPLVHPRVGDEYQVEIPSILSNTELLQLMRNPADSEDIVDSSRSFLRGLPIPVMYLRMQQANIIKNERLEIHDSPLPVHKNGLVHTENLALIRNSLDMKDAYVKVEAPNKTYVSNGKWLVPGRPNETWSDFEADCFLLGLYLLGKNLLQVTRFVESKGLGQVLAYYYGQFYASAGYRRWSECRKMRSRKCVIGHRFFSGYRQQELFSRVFPLLSEEHKTKLLETSRAFAEGSSSLDEYVFTLKAVVGIKGLVDAVSVGKGKKDLTVLISDGSKNSQISSHRPEVPSGKACSALTCSEIVKYLTGDFRLSKARSNDLFWEAVWPRLLARGWHSEQPRGNGYKGSNHLVFLMPGIKKFSRRKLSKGEHYFDSISDVLSKVGGKPELLQLEDDEINSSCSKGENGWATKVKLEDDQDSSDQERRCYLKPRVSLGLSDLTEFTIVDTSLADEDNPFKVTELRGFPVEATICFTNANRMRKDKTKLHVKADVLTNGLRSSSFVDHLIPFPPHNPMNHKARTIKSFVNHLIPFPPHNPMNHKARTIKHQFSRRAKADLSSCGSSVTKRRKLSACVDKDVACVLSLPAKKTRNATLRIVGPKLSQTDIKLTSDDALVADNHTDQKSVQDTSDGNCVDFVTCQENEKLPALQQEIDLNLPQVPSEPESYDEVNLVEEVNSSTQNSYVEKLQSFDAEIQKHFDVQKQRHSDFAKQKNSEDTTGPDNMEPRLSCPSREPSNLVLDSDQKPERHVDAQNQKISGDTVGPSNSMETQVSSKEPANNAVVSDQQSRRQSTRNRPLTTKALEALEVGLSSPVRQYRKRSPSVIQDQKPKRLRQPQNKSPMFPHDIVIESKETCNGKTDIIGQAPTGSIPMRREM